MSEKPTFKDAPFSVLHISVQYIFRANFNDAYFLDEYEIPIDTLPRDTLYWFDPYFGKSKRGVTRTALVAYGEDYFTMRSDEDGKITEQRLEPYMDFIVCEDYDETKMLAAHISARGFKRGHKK
jgi:hypothetical protein